MSASAAISAVHTTYDTVLSHASIRVQRLPRTREIRPLHREVSSSHSYPAIQVISRKVTSNKIPFHAECSATSKRDCILFAPAAFRIIKIQTVDFYMLNPQNAHVQKHAKYPEQNICYNSQFRKEKNLEDWVEYLHQDTFTFRYFWTLHSVHFKFVINAQSPKCYVPEKYL